MGKREKGEFTGGGEQRKEEREMMQSYLISKKQKIKGPNFFFMCMGVLPACISVHQATFIILGLGYLGQFIF